MEGRLPAEVASFLMPLMARGLIKVEAWALRNVSQVDYFTSVGKSKTLARWR